MFGTRTGHDVPLQLDPDNLPDVVTATYESAGLQAQASWWDKGRQHVHYFYLDKAGEKHLSWEDFNNATKRDYPGGLLLEALNRFGQNLANAVGSEVEVKCAELSYKHRHAPTPRPSYFDRRLSVTEPDLTVHYTD